MAYPPKASAKKRARKPPEAEDSTAVFERLLKKRYSHSQRFVLKLFITGSTARSTTAIANIRALCEEKLAGRYDLEVVDIYQQPTQAKGEQIIAAPTLIRKFPRPARRMVGDLSDRARVLIGLEINEGDKPSGAQPGETQWIRV